MRGGLCFSCLRVFLVICTVLHLSVGPVNAESVKVRAAAHDGYGRIVFNWPTLVPFKIKTVGDQLIVSFSSPIEPSLSGVVRNLSKYLSGAVAGADGRSVAFTMKEDFDVYGFDMGATVVVDITDAILTKKVANSRKEKVSKQPAEAPTSGPIIKVRSGIHDDYTRIVFDWPTKVPYKLRQTAGPVSYTHLTLPTKA